MSGNTTIGSETIDREEFLVVADQEDFMLIQKNNSEYVICNRLVLPDFGAQLSS